MHPSARGRQNFRTPPRAGIPFPSFFELAPDYSLTACLCRCKTVVSVTPSTGKARQCFSNGWVSRDTHRPLSVHILRFPRGRLEAAPEFESNASAFYNAKGVHPQGTTGPTYAWTAQESLGGRVDRKSAESRLEDRMGAAFSKVRLRGVSVCRCSGPPDLLGRVCSPALVLFLLLLYGVVVTKAKSIHLFPQSGLVCPTQRVMVGNPGGRRTAAFLSGYCRWPLPC